MSDDGSSIETNSNVNGRDSPVDDGDDEKEEPTEAASWLPPARAAADPLSTGPHRHGSEDDEVDDDDFISGSQLSRHSKMETFRLNSDKGRSSQIIPDGSPSTNGGHRRRRRRGAAAAESPTSSTGSFPHILKRVTIEYPFEITRIDHVKDVASSSSSTKFPWWSVNSTSSASSRRLVDIVTGVPVSRNVSASMHCQAGMKGSRTAFSATDFEVRYRPSTTTWSRDHLRRHVEPSSKAVPPRSKLDVTYTAGVALTDRPRVSAGATFVSTDPQTKDGRSTTWSCKFTSPKLNIGDLSKSSSFTTSWWWSGLSCRVGWSKDVAAFCIFRSSVAATLPKVNGISLTSKSSRARQSDSIGLVSSLTSASVALSSRNTVHKWSAALSWSPLNFTKRGVDSKGVGSRVGGTPRKSEPDASKRSSSTSWWPRITLSVSPQLSKRLWERTCHVSGWYSLSDLSWSVAASTAKALNGSQLSVGWTQTSSGSWTYLVTVPLGSTVTLRIPVTVTAVMDPFWYPVQVSIVSILSGLVQEAVLNFLASPSKRASDQQGTNSIVMDSAAVRRQRAKQLAENQQALMRRTAENRMRVELAKNTNVPKHQQNGLVIDRAVYYTDRESWDVTVPLQFWVLDSVLDIGPATKKDLLGFYDLSYRADLSIPNSERPAPSWISGFWRRREKDDDRRSMDVNSNGNSAESGTTGGRQRSSHATQLVITPKLLIEYTYRGTSYHETFRDDDEIVLPRRHNDDVN